MNATIVWAPLIPLPASEQSAIESKIRATLHACGYGEDADHPDVTIIVKERPDPESFAEATTWPAPRFLLVLHTVDTPTSVDLSGAPFDGVFTESVHEQGKAACGAEMNVAAALNKYLVRFLVEAAERPT